ncbi:MAG: transporter substrate-binding domain-containing protein [Myxococcales bacterium]|nr:transporter substrate-binding domain-containing protein [Myxococcales bacterium]
MEGASTSAGLSEEALHLGELIDLPEILARGTLRLLVVSRGEPTQFLPRKDLPIVEFIGLAEQLAQYLGVEPVLVEVPAYHRLIPSLLSGRGDMIAEMLTITPQRKKKVAFARAVAGVREVVVGSADMKAPPETIKDLKGRVIHIRKSSAYADTLQRLAIEGLTIVPVDERIHTAEIISDVASGDRPLTIADAPILAAVQGYEPRARGLFTLNDEGRALAWAVRPGSAKLLSAIDQFQTERAVIAELRPLFLGDLEAIKSRGVLRVLTRNNAVSFFIHRGRPVGFEYELVRMLADELHVRLAMIVAPDRASLIPWLREGKGDLIAASLTVSEDRAEDVIFSRPYMFVDEVVVHPEEERGIQTINDLDTKVVHVRRSSTYWRSLKRLQRKGLSLQLVPAPEWLETEELIEQVAQGTIPLTVADSHILQVEQTYGTTVKAGPILASPSSNQKGLAFAVRPNSRALKAYLDAFVKRTYRGLAYNIFKKKYFKSSKKIRSFKEFRVGKTKEISPFDPTIKKYARRYGLDWRLLVAQAYVESGFDAKAKSWVGATGVFQVLVSTGKSMGFNRLSDPEQGIHAGVRYMSQMVERFDPELPLDERLWFALAAYNAGYGHVYDARRLARKKGWDADRWFANVERAMRLLAQPVYARGARHGYCRGEEPVAYVRSIRDLYISYQEVLNANDVSF